MSPIAICFFYYGLYQPPTDKVSSSKNGLPSSGAIRLQFHKIRSVIWKPLDYVIIFRYLRQTGTRYQRFDSGTLNDANRTVWVETSIGVPFDSILKLYLILSLAGPKMSIWNPKGYHIKYNAHADMASSVASLLALATGAIRRIFAISVVGNLCQRQFSKKTFRFSNRLVANVQSYCVSVGNI